MKTMHLFAGAGGGILADLILGHRPVVAVEWEPYACQVLRERVADGWFPGMQVWEGDVRLFDPSEYKGRVDCIHAGFPCQDISTAGNQAGVGEGTRSGLYREVLRIADEVRPSHIFLENVAAIVTGDNGSMLRTVIGDLAERGYDAVWTCLSAAEVGAAHKRNRWWLLAYSKHSSGREEVGRINAKQTREASCKRKESGDTRKSIRTGGDSKDVAYTSSEGLQGRQKARDSESIRQGRNEQLERCGYDTRPAWAVESNLGRVVDDLASRMDDGSTLASWSEVEAKVGRVIAGSRNRAARLKALGNGQVPLQAATAFSILWQMMEAVE